METLKSLSPLLVLAGIVLFLVGIFRDTTRPSRRDDGGGGGGDGGGDC